MFSYKTIQEKADEWQMPVKRLQNLCRTNKLPGAVKRGGVWFIPDTVPHPTETADQELRFQGTKRKIFEAAIILFSQKGYEAVSIKDIADEVGVAGSAVYNHFKSKQEILEAIYAFLCRYHSIDRPTLEDLIPVVRDGSLTDIFTCVYYAFKEEYYALLLASIKLLFQRAFIDSRAREIFRTVLLGNGIDFVTQFYDLAVAMGRLAPFDTHAMSVLCNMSRWFGFLNVLAYPDMTGGTPEQIKTQEMMYEYAVNNFTDLRCK